MIGDNGGNSSSEQPKKEPSKRAHIIASMIIVSILAVIVGVVVYVWVDAIENSKSVVERGCTPTAFNQFGIITAWRCPAGITP